MLDPTIVLALFIISARREVGVCLCSRYDVHQIRATGSRASGVIGIASSLRLVFFATSSRLPTTHYHKASASSDKPVERASENRPQQASLSKKPCEAGEDFVRDIFHFDVLVSNGLHAPYVFVFANHVLSCHHSHTTQHCTEPGLWRRGKAYVCKSDASSRREPGECLREEGMPCTEVVRAVQCKNGRVLSC